MLLQEPSQLFSTWNSLNGTLESSFEDEAIGSSKVAQSLYLDDEDDSPVIPDIEELRESDFIQQTADAPTVEINRLDNLEELDKKVKKMPFLVTSDNIDLSILATRCMQEDAIRENDIEWSIDKLLSDVMYNADIVKLNKKAAEESGKVKE